MYVTVTYINMYIYIYIYIFMKVAYTSDEIYTVSHVSNMRVKGARYFKGQNKFLLNHLLKYKLENTYAPILLDTIYQTMN